MPTRSESKPPASTAVNQLCLPLRLPGRGGFDAFVDDGNEDLVELLRRWAASPGTGDVLIHGEPGCGKSHLLHAAHEAATAAGASARFVALDLPALSPSVLEGLEDCDAVIIDAAHGVAGVRDWELALFNLYNALHHPGMRPADAYCWRRAARPRPWGSPCPIWPRASAPARPTRSNPWTTGAAHDSCARRRAGAA
jgi:chromosomal replication initiation ATPase DnaA